LSASVSQFLWRAAPLMHARLQLSPAHRVRALCRGALLLQLLDAYAVRYSEMLDGRSCHMPVSELAGGARIRHIFQEIFVTGLQNLNPSGHAARAAAPRAGQELKSAVFGMGWSAVLKLCDGILTAKMSAVES